ncbi:TetR/AcrR family transcriptional regulator [Actinomycetospora termitidis]|uniref:TetR/AcrR family transcriptional regulator n=1 Tax=Actinomycetospora termitidis TaxID=3053470 RepID=A0ABT7MF01_9PSEU|nr:TetR/AcrR family transcriptional regulator [Actinomycetospora sp. Odt1-22]MDL5159243.1 TetR/AcrR family transcriptional regulator [Actinomycetospora sp. Odt1-22]
MGQATREGFFDAALRLLAAGHDDGVASSEQRRARLKLAPLCRAVGVTTGSFYHHFEGWDGFVEALLEHWETTETARLVEAAGREADALERLSLLTHLALTFPHEAEAAIRAWAHVDPRVAVVQRRVDHARWVAVAECAEEVLPGEGGEVASVALDTLIGFQCRLRPLDVDDLRTRFARVLRLSGLPTPDGLLPRR